MAVTCKHTLSGTIRRLEYSVLSGALDRPSGLAGTLPGTLVFSTAADIPKYEGAYEVTPSDQGQILPTAGRMLKEDIKVGKIPEQYGLISYNQDRIITIT